MSIPAEVISRMSQSKFSKSLAALSATFTGAIVISAGFALPARASSTLDRDPALLKNLSLGVEFQSSGQAAPRSSIGGGVRGSIRFAAPGSTAPNRSVSGGVRGDVQFETPGMAAPERSVSGGVRGDVEFEAPEEVTPRDSVSGGVRGDVQFEAPGAATPRDSASGGVRGDESVQLTALLPPTQHGQTQSARPTFYVYVPPTASTEVFFSIQDENGNPLYHTVLSISGEGGTLGVKLPESAPELEVGTNYLWALAPIEPNGILRPDNFSVVGWVQRIEASVSPENISNPVELATAYGASGLWYDTLEVLANAQLERPGDETFSKEWKDLLEQVGLESVATQPIVK